MEHEAFHAYQAMLARERLSAAEEAARWEKYYPWDDQAMGKAWNSEMDLLVRAAQAEAEGETSRLTAAFLAERDARRDTYNLSPDLVDYERQREWLEGSGLHKGCIPGRLIREAVH